MVIESCSLEIYDRSCYFAEFIRFNFMATMKRAPFSVYLLNSEKIRMKTINTPRMSKIALCNRFTQSILNARISNPVKYFFVNISKIRRFFTFPRTTHLTYIFTQGA